MQNAKSPPTPLLKDLSDDALVTAYWAHRALAANADNMVKLYVQTGARGKAQRAAGMVMKNTRLADIALALLRRRGVSPVRPAA